MKKFFLYNPEDGRVASYSDGENESEKFIQIELDLTDEDGAKLDRNYDLFIEKDQLIFRENNRIIKENFLQKLKDPKVEFSDIKDLLIQLVN